MEAEAGENEINDDKSWIRQALASRAVRGRLAVFPRAAAGPAAPPRAYGKAAPAHVDVLFMAMHTLFFRMVSHSSQIVVTKR